MPSSLAIVIAVDLRRCLFEKGILQSTCILGFSLLNLYIYFCFIKVSSGFFLHLDALFHVKMSCLSCVTISWLAKLLCLCVEWSHFTLFKHSFSISSTFTSDSSFNSCVVTRDSIGCINHLIKSLAWNTTQGIPVLIEIAFRGRAKRLHITTWSATQNIMCFFCLSQLTALRIAWTCMIH